MGKVVLEHLLKITNLACDFVFAGIFHARGVMTNVLIFDNREAIKKPLSRERPSCAQEEAAKVSATFRNSSAATTRKIVTSVAGAWDVGERSGGRWRKLKHEELIARGQTSLDALAEEIIENLEGELNSFREMISTLAGTIV
ncbi:hypothetical protein [Steroidobacter cummioxidans]|uniref:hypothetical protein n=1 Tax=Steroidobacter cummioxidans TaxID=1803913 RepID=UPI000E30CABF|nr:hypothetical protein [Steroidobacter cummioxidans]